MAERSPAGRTMTVVVCVLAGFMMTVSALASRGTDLRADRSADMRELILSQRTRNEDLRAEAETLRQEIDDLRRVQGADPALGEDLAQAGVISSTVAMTGPGMRVVLTDAPADVKPAGIDDDALIVHQQDIQAVVNALWSAGAEAMTIQGQRVVSTTGIKCVGNSVVLHGVPYAPPYVIDAIGDQGRMERALADSEALQVYRQYAEAFGLGYSQERVGTLRMPGFAGSVGIDEAQVLR